MWSESNKWKTRRRLSKKRYLACGMNLNKTICFRDCKMCSEIYLSTNYTQSSQKTVKLSSPKFIKSHFDNYRESHIYSFSNSFALVVCHHRLSPSCVYLSVFVHIPSIFLLTLISVYLSISIYPGSGYHLLYILLWSFNIEVTVPQNTYLCSYMRLMYN